MQPDTKEEATPKHQNDPRRRFWMIIWDGTGERHNPLPDYEMQSIAWTVASFIWNGTRDSAETDPTVGHQPKNIISAMLCDAALMKELASLSPTVIAARITGVLDLAYQHNWFSKRRVNGLPGRPFGYYLTRGQWQTAKQLMKPNEHNRRNKGKPSVPGKKNRNRKKHNRRNKEREEEAKRNRRDIKSLSEMIDELLLTTERMTEVKRKAAFVLKIGRISFEIRY